MQLQESGASVCVWLALTWCLAASAWNVQVPQYASTPAADICTKYHNMIS